MHLRTSIGRRLIAIAVAAMAPLTRVSAQHLPEEWREGPYAIGLWGELPYSDTQALTGAPNLIADMNRHDLAFTVHDGDLKAGNGTPGSVTPTTCSDQARIVSANRTAVPAP